MKNNQTEGPVENGFDVDGKHKNMVGTTEMVQETTV